MPAVGMTHHVVYAPRQFGLAELAGFKPRTVLCHRVDQAGFVRCDIDDVGEDGPIEVWRRCRVKIINTALTLPKHYFLVLEVDSFPSYQMPQDSVLPQWPGRVYWQYCVGQTMRSVWTGDDALPASWTSWHIMCICWLGFSPSLSPSGGPCFLICLGSTGCRAESRFPGYILCPSGILKHCCCCLSSSCNSGSHNQGRDAFGHHVSLGGIVRRGRHNFLVQKFSAVMS